MVVVYYESRKRELKIRLMNEGRCDERLKARVEESMRLIDERFASVMGECVIGGNTRRGV